VFVVAGGSSTGSGLDSRRGVLHQRCSASSCQFKRPFVFGQSARVCRHQPWHLAGERIIADTVSRLGPNPY